MCGAGVYKLFVRGPQKLMQIMSRAVRLT